MSVNVASTGRNGADREETAAAESRLGPADELQIRLILRTPQAQRFQALLDLQDIFLGTWYRRLRRAHPELSDLEVCRLMFERLSRNG